ncbi:preprotein translocase subunit SecY [Candidatus Nomurabacteria bacterium RIFCSPLOWO2_01_FULL_36_10b]|uniref:Protein translocase subunit SecY n=1 Tax=Candidatus Nomurabacteria bacterium RIFCSPLOWO2_01_FULL_36_10b TaxID=1801766 RepID=A0A1F6WPC6_9BACT|nr:MAG: preprotein translocase subunit SecY [Candidatus Nomurabacteria bacterium RIFCSPLOWO2_01_FULL_36_10b]
MNVFLKKLEILVRDRFLRTRVLFILGIFAIFRLLSTIPIPGVDVAALQNFLQGNQFFGLLNIFSGGALSQLSIVMLGTGPFITGSIIIQLLTILSPKLKDMYHHQGEIGRKKFNQVSRLITIPIAALQGFGLLALLTQQGIIQNLGIVGTITNLIIVISGAMLTMWLGELISEYGFGNGVSLIIFAGIVASIPSNISQLIFTYTPSQLPTYIGLLVAIIVLVAGIIYIAEAERPLPVIYAKHSRGGQTYGGTASYIPLRINIAGVMPIIFGISILLFPRMIANFFMVASNATLQRIGNIVNDIFNNGWFYGITYFILVFLFTYFYTAITFDPESMADNLQKGGAFIPGVRPGMATREYIGMVVNRITLVSALFLAVLPIIPTIVQSATGITSFALGGTSILIVVGVISDLINKLDAQIAMREY